MEQVYAYYRLKKGADRDAFLAHMQQVDAPAMRTQPGVERFNVYLVEEEPLGPFGFDVVEDIVVDRFETWDQLCKAPEHQKYIEQWRQWADADSLVFVRTRGGP